MAGSAVKPIRDGIYALLNADATLTTTLGATIYIGTQADAAFPYVEIGPDTEILENTFGRNGRDFTVSLEIWDSNIEGSVAYSINNRISELLDFTASLTATGWTVISCHLDGTNSFNEENYRHISTRYRVRVEK